MAVATIQDCVPGLSPDIRMALAPFNDVILPEAGQRRLPILNLRSVCVEPTDYAGSSPIEFLAEVGARSPQRSQNWCAHRDAAAPRAMLHNVAIA